MLSFSRRQKANYYQLFSRVYEGNQPDSVTFSKVLDDLVARYQMFKERCRRVTLVFDKGNNSEENMEALDGSPYDIIKSELLSTAAT